MIYKFVNTNALNETPWTEVQGFFRATRLRRIAYASLRAPFIPRFKSLGFSGRFYKILDTRFREYDEIMRFVFKLPYVHCHLKFKSGQFLADLKFKSGHLILL